MQKFTANKQKILLLLSLVVLFTGTKGAIAAISADPQAKSNQPDGETIYRENCAICHGDNGDGNTRAQSGLKPPPRNFTTVEAAMELSRSRMIKSVTNGRPGTGMMPHKDRLSKAEIAAVVDFIRGRFMRTPTETTQAVDSTGGKEIYEKNCAVCHGDKGNTAVWARSGLNPAPRDFTTAEASQILSRDRMIHSVTHGRPGTGMMPFAKKFTAKEIASVVDYIRGNFMQLGAKSQVQGMSASTSQSETSTPSSASMAPHQGPHTGMPNMGMPNMVGTMPSGHVIDADMSLPLPNNLTGDVAWGREFYMKNCFTCHGVTGEGNGPRASFNIPRPRNFTSDDSRRILNRPRIYNSITNGRTGSVMPAWGKVLDTQQIANLAEFVFEAFIQPDKFNALPAATTTNKKKAP